MWTKKIATCLLFAIILLTGCAEEDFGIGRDNGKNGSVRLSVSVDELKDLDATRGSTTFKNKEFSGTNTPMYARCVQEGMIHKYLKARRQEGQGAFGIADNSSSPQEILSNSESPLLSGGKGEATRGRRIDSIPDFYDSYGLISFMFSAPNNWASRGATTVPYVYNEQVRRATDWVTNEEWPGANKNLSFFAYAPYHAAGVTLSPDTMPGTPYLHYVVPDVVQNQNDLLISANEHEVGNYNADRLIHFRHICTGIRFAIGTKMAPCTIKKITLQGVYGRGDYTFGANSWSSVDSIRTFTLTQSFPVTEDMSNVILTNADNVFMLVPQTVPSGAKLILEIDDGETHTLEADISDDVWPMGTMTTYYLSTLVTTSNYVLNIEMTNNTVAYTGGNASYTVTSYKRTPFGSEVAVPWTTTYQLDTIPTVYTGNDGTVVTALNKYSGGTGSSFSEACTMTLIQQTPVQVEIGNERNWGSDKSGTFDLSTHDLDENSIAQTTANCYVINAKGTYTLPLVYGNARKNGADNATAYYSAGGTFVDHNNVVIDNPYIYLSNGGANAPDGATLIWQTSPSLITSVSLVNSNHDLQFTVGDLEEGNAIVAATKEETVVWSWHIWFTKRKPELTTTIAVDDYDDSSIKYNFMPVTLGSMGFRDGINNVYPERNVKITIRQTESAGLTASSTITLAEGSALASNSASIGSAPFYQWGRKDPMAPSTPYSPNTTPTNMTLYDLSGSTYSGFGYQTAANMGITIQRPNKLGNSSDHIHANSATNGAKDYWDIGKSDFNQSSAAITKTVYDPSPQGFCVPPSAALRIFSSTGENTTSSGQINKENSWNSSKPGWNFYTVKQSSVWAGITPTIFFPAYGQRERNNSLWVVGSFGAFWSAGPYSAETGWLLYFSSGQVNPQIYTYRSYGFTVWPVSE